MTAIPPLLRRATLAGACLLALGWGPVAHAAVVDLPFEGAGNVVLFDPLAGSGGWVGSADEVLAPGFGGGARQWVSVVTFSFDARANTLSGAFEFTDALDLDSTVFGTLLGAFTNPLDRLATGGQWALDYTVAGGTGSWQGASGFGLSFLTYDPVATTFNNYSEQGLLVLTVPEPGTLPMVLLGAALLVAYARRRQRQRG